MTVGPETPGVRCAARSLFKIFLSCIGWRKKSRDDLSNLMDVARSADLIDARAASMMEGVAQVGETRVRDIMIPRSQMIGINKDDGWEDAIKTIANNGHSRYPVMDENLSVVGVLLAKDMLAREGEKAGDNEDKSEGNEFVLQDLIRPAVFIPESKRLNTLLEEFKRSRNHMAIVVDEYGGVSGLITIEDVVEQIVGDIADEHDAEAVEDIRYHDGQWLINGATSLDDFNRHFSTQINGREGTVAGLVIRNVGHLPRKGDSVEVNNFVFTVTRADNRRIYQLAVIAPQDVDANN